MFSWVRMRFSKAKVSKKYSKTWMVCHIGIRDASILSTWELDGFVRRTELQFLSCSPRPLRHPSPCDREPPELVTLKASGKVAHTPESTGSYFHTSGLKHVSSPFPPDKPDRLTNLLIVRLLLSKSPRKKGVAEYTL